MNTLCVLPQANVPQLSPQWIIRVRLLQQLSPIGSSLAKLNITRLLTEFVWQNSGYPAKIVFQKSPQDSVKKSKKQRSK